MRLTTRQLINQVGNFPGTRVDRDGSVWRVGAVLPLPGNGQRVLLWPAHLAETDAGIGRSVAVAAEFMDTPMWDVISAF